MENFIFLWSEQYGIIFLRKVKSDTGIAVFKYKIKEKILNFSNGFLFFKIHIIITSNSVFLLHKTKHFVCFLLSI